MNYITIEENTRKLMMKDLKKLPPEPCHFCNFYIGGKKVKCLKSIGGNTTREELSTDIFADPKFKYSRTFEPDKKLITINTGEPLPKVKTNNQIVIVLASCDFVKGKMKLQGGQIGVLNGKLITKVGSPSPDGPFDYNFDYDIEVLSRIYWEFI